MKFEISASTVRTSVLVLIGTKRDLSMLNECCDRLRANYVMAQYHCAPFHYYLLNYYY